MTTPTTTETTGAAAPGTGDSRGNDQVPAEFAYGHGRMPFFMKLVWLAFLGFGAWYTVSFLLTALADEVG